MYLSIGVKLFKQTEPLLCVTAQCSSFIDKSNVDLDKVFTLDGVETTLGRQRLQYKEIFKRI
jgi:hypothetical protein